MLTRYDVGLGGGLFDSRSKLLDLFFDDRVDGYDTLSRNGYIRTAKTDEGITLSMDIPGVKRDELEIISTSHNLQITGKSKSRTFSYRYHLDKSYDIESATAVLEDGILEISFKKSEAALPRKISIGIRNTHE